MAAQRRTRGTLRIRALQARIRPHFLFNCLNTVAALTRSDPGRAEEAIEDLADLFRVSLSEARARITLREELEVARLYQRMEQLRLGDRLQVRWRVAELPHHAVVPSLLLQPLLENAIGHGIEPLPDGGTLTVAGHCDSDDVVIEIANPNSHLRKGIRNLFLLAAILIVFSLACNLPQKASQAPTDEIPISTASAQELEDNIRGAVEKFEETGQIDIKITETQITSYVALQVENQPSPVFTNPQIRLQNGEIRLSADILQNGLAIPMKAKITVAVDESGSLVYDIKSASLGTLPLPTSLTDQIQSQIDQAINVNFSKQLSAISIQEVVIADGVMELHGKAR